MKKMFVFMIATTLCLTFLGPYNADAANKAKWVMPSSSTGSSPYVLGGVISQFINENSKLVQIFPQNASGYKENMIMLNNGGSTMIALSTVADLNTGYAGTGEYPKPLTNTRALFNYRTTALNIVVLADSGINDIPDLVGKRVQVGNVGTMTFRNAKIVLSNYGIDVAKDIDPIRVATGEAVQQLKDGRIDAAFIFGANHSGIMEIAVTKKIKLLPISDDKKSDILEEAAGTIPVTISAGRYKGVDYDVPTIGTTGTIAVHKDADPDIVYEITKLMWENVDDLAEKHSDFKTMVLENAITGIKVPFHPGVEKYLKEIGVIQ
jgi:hypothetical protein